MKAAEDISTVTNEGILPPDDRSEPLDIVIHNDTNRLSEDDKEWLESVIAPKSNHEVEKIRNSTIEKVPRIFRKNEANKDCFDPLVVSIGPYHHGNPDLKDMEKHKLTMAQQYVDNNLHKLEVMYKNILFIAKAVRDCYTDKDSMKNFDDKKLTQMMVLDGCFVLQFLYCVAKDKHDQLKIKSNIAALVQRDLLLLENQLPFQVLKKLMREKEELENISSVFIGGHVGNSCIAKIKNFFSRKSQAPAKKINSEDEPAHLLAVVRTQLINKSENTIPPGKRNDWSSFRSAKELKAMGIHSRPSNTNKFTDVTFTSIFFAGFLKLPPIKVDDSTKPMLLNMVAYEACPEVPSDFGVASYIWFMDSLIDHPEDVKELRSKGIILNFLGSDQQVADLFNEITDNLVPDLRVYADVKVRIDKHCKNKINIWLAECLHTHFASPWTFLAFIGAMFALCLSAVQTYVALYPP